MYKNGVVCQACQKDEQVLANSSDVPRWSKFTFSETESYSCINDVLVLKLRGACATTNPQLVVVYKHGDNLNPLFF